jgi:putative ABC transport system permease protein
MMRFASLKGNPVTALRDASSVVVTANTAKRLFGGDDPIGKTIISGIQMFLRSVP